MSKAIAATSSGGKRNLPPTMDPLLPSSTASKKNDDVSSPSNEPQNKKKKAISGSATFSNLLDGVVFVLSGFVNPERATLRSHALEMGAEYRPDWGPDCTLLVCAYSNTPKFRQVEADCGTIVKKEWILDCYEQKKLVDVDEYLMFAGKPWRKGGVSNGISNDQKASPTRKSEKKIERASQSKSIASSSAKSRTFHPSKEHFPPSKVKAWAIDDLNKTISWLESQEEKPEPSEIRQIAAGGILICIQDAIDCLEQDQEVRQITDQWNVIPHVIEELVKLIDAGNPSDSLPKKDICTQMKACKEVYEVELNSLNDNSKVRGKKKTADETRTGDNVRKDANGDAAGYDSDETIEMTEEEIDLAYSKVASTFGKG